MKMKICILFLLIFSSFTDGNDSLTPLEEITNEQNLHLNDDDTPTINVTWTYTDANKITNIFMTVTNLDAEKYAAVGLGQTQSMGEAHVFMCKRLSNNTIALERYMNPGKHNQSIHAGSEQGGQLTVGQLTLQDNIVTCQFTLSNFATESLKQVGTLNPLSQSGSYYPLVAVGSLNSNDEPKYHGDTREAQGNTVQLNKQETILYGITTTTTSVSTTSTTSGSTQTTTATTITTTSSSTATTAPPTTTPTGSVSINATWTFDSDKNTTDITIIVRNLDAEKYAAVGLGQTQSMGEAHVFMCKRLSNNTIALERYMNPGKHNKSIHAGSEQGGQLTVGQVTFKDGIVTCQFTLSNFATESLKQVGTLNPLSQSGSYYPLVAVGPLDSNDEPKYHEDTREAQGNTVQLNKQETILYGITTTTTSVSTTSTTSGSTQTTTAPPTTTPTGTVGIYVKCTYTDSSKLTNISMTITKLDEGQYAAVGLGQTQSMGEAHVFMCKRLSNNTIALERYINPGNHNKSMHAGSEQGGQLTVGQVTFKDGIVTCQFTLSNFATKSLKQVGTLNPLSQSGSYYPLFAAGSLDDNNEPTYHEDTREAQGNTVQLNKEETISYGVGTTTQSPFTTTQTASPTAQVGINVTIIYTPTNNVTNISMIITNLKTKQYAAFAFGQNTAMGEAHVFMCKLLENSQVTIARYKNPSGHKEPESVGSEDGGVMTIGQQLFENGIVTCQFTLSNFNNSSHNTIGTLRTLTQSDSYYPLFAIGLLNDQNAPQQHAGDSRAFQKNQIQLNQNRSVVYNVNNPSYSSKKYFQVHGILMIIVWIFLSSTAAIIARYFKTSWGNKLICGKAAWYAIHRFVMSISVVLTMIAFLFVLVASKGNWVSSDGDIKHYVHSITGAIVISFAFFQPFLALFRCDPGTRYRFIFDYLHAFIGVSALLLSIVTLFLATYFDLFSDLDRARVIMIIWTIWIVFIYMAYEVIRRYYAMRSQNDDLMDKTIDEINDTPTSSTLLIRRTNEEKVKNVLLALHILIAAILSIWFSLSVR